MFILMRALTYAGLFFEEPTLRGAFGREYEDYCRRVHRWRPRFR